MNDHVRPRAIYATAAATDALGSAIGVVYIASAFPGCGPVRVLDHAVTDWDALTVQRLREVYTRMNELAEEFNAAERHYRLFCEAGDLFARLEALFVEMPDIGKLLHTAAGCPFDLIQIDEKGFHEMDLEARARAVRGWVNSGAVKILNQRAGINRLLAQLLSFAPGQRDAPTELVAAFALACLIERKGY